MVITLADWVFSVDVERTREYTRRCTEDHCNCAYCRNYYETVELAHPGLKPVLAAFGVDINGPSEVMPLEPTLVMTCYRVTGQILRRGSSMLHVDGVPLRPEDGDGDSFLLWAGEMVLPWVQQEAMEDVVSPANEPEFMERMLSRWLITREDFGFS